MPNPLDLLTRKSLWVVYCALCVALGIAAASYFYDAPIRSVVPEGVLIGAVLIGISWIFRKGTKK